MPRQRQHNPLQALETAFSEACDALPPLHEGAHLLLACSAGGDSMALLHLAAGLAHERRWRLHIAHIDHALRAESADEADFVRAQAGRYDLPCTIRRVEPSTVSAEAVLREERRTFFHSLATEINADALLLAHQADDRAETLLMRLLEGAGPAGLASIRPVDRRDGLTLVRPLLELRRTELREWLHANDFEWRDDPTNADVHYERNWLRHRLLPLVHEHYGFDVSEKVARAAALIDEEARGTLDAVDRLLARLRLDPPAGALGRLTLDEAEWREAGPELRRLLLRRWLWQLSAEGFPPLHAPTCEAVAFAERGRPRTELRTSEGRLILHCKTSLVAFAAGSDPVARHAAADELTPPPARPKRKKRNQP